MNLRVLITRDLLHPRFLLGCAFVAIYAPFGIITSFWRRLTSPRSDSEKMATPEHPYVVMVYKYGGPDVTRMFATSEEADIYQTVESRDPNTKEVKRSFVLDEDGTAVNL